MKWADHDHWATSMGIREGVSRKVNTIIDAVDQGDKIPSEYHQALATCAQEWTEKNAPNSKSAMDAVISDYSARNHDVERSSKTGGDIAAEVHRCAMREMGEEYLKAWYLHHHLDFLSERWGNKTRLDELLGEYREIHPLTYSSKVERFLKQHDEELVRDLERYRE